MRKQYDGKLTMPESYNVVSNNDMEYLEGGQHIPYRLSYATTIGAYNAAKKYRKDFGFKKISVSDMAAEIFTHSIAAYNMGLLLWGLSKLKYTSAFAQSLLNGIDVIDGLDTRKKFGITYYKAYRAIYCLF